mgnify:CR=1 FL=1
MLSINFSIVSSKNDGGLENFGFFFIFNEAFDILATGKVLAKTSEARCSEGGGDDAGADGLMLALTGSLWSISFVFGRLFAGALTTRLLLFAGVFDRTMVRLLTRVFVFFLLLPWSENKNTKI